MRRSTRAAACGGEPRQSPCSSIGAESRVTTSFASFSAAKAARRGRLHDQPPVGTRAVTNGKKSRSRRFKYTLHSVTVKRAAGRKRQKGHETAVSCAC